MPKLLQRLYETTGMAKAAENSGAVLNLDTSSDKSGEFTIIKPLLDADLIVSIGRLDKSRCAECIGANGTTVNSDVGVDVV